MNKSARRYVFCTAGKTWQILDLALWCENVHRTHITSLVFEYNLFIFKSFNVYSKKTIKLWHLTWYSITAGTLDLPTSLIIFVSVQTLMFLLSRLTHYAATMNNKRFKTQQTSVKTAIYTAVKTSPPNILQRERTHGKQHMLTLPFAHNHTSLHFWSYRYHNSLRFAKTYSRPL